MLIKDISEDSAICDLTIDSLGESSNGEGSVMDEDCGTSPVSSTEVEDIDIEDSEVIDTDDGDNV